MELVDGENLKGPVPVETANSLTRARLRWHSKPRRKGIVHRDLKPAKVKVAPDGTVKLLDSGPATEKSGASENDANPRCRLRFRRP
jgi:serine/threonine protein kinase